jgi:homoserine O-acetyltransferase
LIARDKPVSYCNIDSDCGHDAFLLENNLASYGEMLRAFLANLSLEGPRCACNIKPPAAPAEPAASAQTGLPAGTSPLPRITAAAGAKPANAPVAERHGPTSIFHRHLRLDYDSIAELVPPGASVLDVGCGNGGLLAELCRRGHRRLMGVELDEWAILECIRRGLDVVHGDLNRGLAGFSNEQFDYVILSRTLQAVRDVETAVAEMLRVGRKGIVSFPNLGYHRLRSQLANDGRAPRVEAEEGFRWYNTPNVRFLSIADFDQFCGDKGYRILKRVALDTEEGREVTDDPNLRADVAIFVVSR